MPRYIVHHEGVFFEWSTVVDAPVSPAMTREEFERYYQDRHGPEGMRELPERLERALARGCSTMDPMSAEDCVAVNRAGPDESTASFAEVMAQVRSDEERAELGLPPLPAVAST